MAAGFSGCVFNLKDCIKEMQMVYQIRYAKYVKDYKNNPNDMDAHGHAMECSFVLINLFGLSEREIRQLEMRDFAGLLDADLEN